MDLRKDYELRLTEFKVKEDKQNQMFHNMLALNEKQIENYTSNASLTHIEHQNLLQKGNLTMKQLINEKRTMEAQIKSKNEEIGKLNARIEKMFALHKRDIEKL